MRPEYDLSSLSGPAVRGKYAARLRESSHFVAPVPEVSATFPGKRELKNVLSSLLRFARKLARVMK